MIYPSYTKAYGVGRCSGSILWRRRREAKPLWNRILTTAYVPPVQCVRLAWFRRQ
jgi:hypothetical protein